MAFFNGSDSNRRDFLKFSALGLVLAPIVAKSADVKAPAGCTAVVAENDPMAKALGLVSNVKKVDKVKYGQKYKVGQLCGNCMFFKSTKEGDARNADVAPCDPIFQKKCVNGGGWCGSWAPDPKHFKA
jgi:hypothetical protein